MFLFGDVQAATHMPQPGHDNTDEQHRFEHSFSLHGNDGWGGGEGRARRDVMVQFNPSSGPRLLSVV